MTSVAQLDRAEFNRLEALLREELAAQRAVLALLEEQQRAVAARTPSLLEDVTARLEGVLASAAARRQRREALVRRIAQQLHVAPSALTLGSLAERLGAAGSVLGALRAEMRSVTSSVVRANRRVAAALAMHRRLNHEVLDLCFGADGSAPSPLAGAGALIDAEV